MMTFADQDLVPEVRSRLIEIIRSEYRKGYDPAFLDPIVNWDVLLSGVWIHFFQLSFLRYDSSRCLEQCYQIIRQGNVKEVVSLIEYFVDHIDDRQPSFLKSVEALFIPNPEKE